MNDYAPLYSKGERIRLALILVAVFAPLILLAHFWLIPLITYYAKYANCFYYDDINGVELLFYAVFVAMPLAFALIVLLIMGPRSLRIIRAGQDPLPKEKVLRKTKYRYGPAAMWFPALTLVVVTAFIGISIWGSFQVGKLTTHIVPCNEEQKNDLETGN